MRSTAKKLIVLLVYVVCTVAALWLIVTYTDKAGACADPQTIEAVKFCNGIE